MPKVSQANWQPHGLNPWYEGSGSDRVLYALYSGMWSGETASLQFYIPLTDWTVLGELKASDVGEYAAGDHEVQWPFSTLRLAEIKSENNGAAVTVACVGMTLSYELLTTVLDLSGKEHLAEHTSTDNIFHLEQSRQISCRFDIPKEEIARVRFRTRLCGRTDFSNIWLRRGKTTGLKVEAKGFTPSLPIPKGKYRLWSRNVESHESRFSSYKEWLVGITGRGKRVVQVTSGADLQEFVVGTDSADANRFMSGLISIMGQIDKDRSVQNFSYAVRSITPSGRAGGLRHSTVPSETRFADLVKVDVSAGDYPIGAALKLGSIEGRQVMLNVR
jgi:hypothetical protein